jgi:phosphoribosylformylglycinamidine cyclo-ligase
MVAIVDPEHADAVTAHARALGMPAWVLGEVATIDAATLERGADDPDLVAGTKGVQGGAVRLTGAYRTV